MRVKTVEGGVPIKMWLDYLEDGAELQAENLARLPFAFKHIAIMPDSHQGFGMPIGAVLATKGVIVPNAVGVDIGCGMNAVKTSIPSSDATYDKVKDVMDRVARKVPVGMNKHQQKQDKNLMPDTGSRIYPRSPIIAQEYEAARYQLGTLGGGNHFIELQAGDDGFVWLMLHSGSRHLGLSVGSHYNKLAQQLNAKYHAGVPKEWDLAFLPVDETEDAYVHYLAEMQYAMEYALASRQLMMSHFMTAVNQVFHNVEFDGMINIPHNFASLEKHYGEKVWVHRKGATQAMAGQYGIIPGSQGTGSYIVIGKGNRESFMSCSHGAGRVMGRKDAQRRLNLAEEQAKMVGIYHNMNNQKAVDEAPGAYKDIDEVMRNQTDLVDVAVKLRPLGNLKG